MKKRAQLRNAHFKTKVGEIVLVWSEQGLTEVRLPGSPVRSRKDVSQDANTPAFVREAADKIVLHLKGKPQSYDSIPLDLSGMPLFHQKVYKHLRSLPAGRTTTYGELARKAGSPRGARAVGQAMASNPLPLIIPCHRVLRGDGTPGHYSALKGTESKIKLLVDEGVEWTGDKIQRVETTERSRAKAK